MKLQLGLLVLVCGCSAITDFDPNKLGSGGAAGSSGSGGMSGAGGSSGSGGVTTGGTGGMSGTGGMPDAHMPDAHMPDASIDAPMAMCSFNTDCNDNNFCTLNICNNGQCVFPPRNCDDNRSCTTDDCNPSFGCTHTPNNDACNDNIDCTIDTCDASGPTPTGCVHTPDNQLCDDGIDCTADTCDPSRGGCLHTPQNQLCSDGNPCTTDVCTASGCQHNQIQGCTPCMSDTDCPGTVCVPCANGSLMSKTCPRHCVFSNAGSTGVCMPDTTSSQCGPCAPICTVGP